MKKGQIYEGTAIDINFPGKAVVLTKEADKNGVINEYHVTVKGAFPGQKIKYILQKARSGKFKGRLLEVIEKSPFETVKPECANFGVCGGCSYQALPYQVQLELKKKQVLKLINSVIEEGSYIFDGIFPSPCIWGYRNKMEFSFGDEYKGGPLSLGLHKKGSIHDIINSSGCKIVNNDYSKILNCIREYFSKRGIPHYNKNTHTGILRHLLVRRSVSTGEILVALVTTSGLENIMCRDGILQENRTIGENINSRNVNSQNVNGQNIDNKNYNSADNICKTEVDLHSLSKSSINVDIQDKNIISVDGSYSNNICPEIQDANSMLADNQNIDKQELDSNCPSCIYMLGLELQHLKLEGRITGFLHIINDGFGDVVKSDETHIIFGKDWITEEILGLKFKISVFSFFQTNTKGAEVLYSCARNYIMGKPAGGTPDVMDIQDVQQGTIENIEKEIKDIPEEQNREYFRKDVNERVKDNTKDNFKTDNYLKDKVVFDLYSGTGTIAQIIAPITKKVTGIEIVEEAVEAAKQNAEYNGLRNCEFIAGDVLKVLEEIDEKPDFIILDPPREGLNPKALEKIGKEMKVPGMVYISCKPTSLVRDIEELKKYGYKVGRVCCVDMFPQTGHVETIVGLQRQDM